MLAGSSDDLVRAARQRLKYWDIPDTVIEELERTGTPRRTITLPSHQSSISTRTAARRGLGPRTRDHRKSGSIRATTASTMVV